MKNTIIILRLCIEIEKSTMHEIGAKAKLRNLKDGRTKPWICTANHGFNEFNSLFLD